MEKLYDDKQLIDKVAQNDKKAFQKLFNKYWEFLHNVAYNRLRSADYADDLVQDVFTDLWENRDTLEIHSSLKAYLYQAIKHKIFNFIRHRSVREKEEYIRRIEKEYYSRNAFDADQLVSFKELQHAVNNEIESLPEKSRRIFQLSRNKQCSYREIAAKLNCSKKTVEYHISKVLHILEVNLAGFLS